MKTSRQSEFLAWNG